MRSRDGGAPSSRRSPRSPTGPEGEIRAVGGFRSQTRSCRQDSTSRGDNVRRDVDSRGIRRATCRPGTGVRRRAGRCRADARTRGEALGSPGTPRRPGRRPRLRLWASSSRRRSISCGSEARNSQPNWWSGPRPTQPVEASPRNSSSGRWRGGRRRSFITWSRSTAASTTSKSAPVFGATLRNEAVRMSVESTLESPVCLWRVRQELPLVRGPPRRRCRFSANWISSLASTFGSVLASHGFGHGFSHRSGQFLCVEPGGPAEGFEA